MLLRLQNLFTRAEVEHCRERLARADWVDGNATSGPVAAQAKHNLQVSEGCPLGQELGGLILGRLGQSPAFLSAALPQKVTPPLFNRYERGMGFGAHVDNAIRYDPEGCRYRTDLSCTLFLSDPDAYDGGELVVEGGFGLQPVKLGAGDLALYPASSIHRVEPITRGARLASFFWVQSMVRNDSQRGILYELDQSIIGARADLSDNHASIVALTSTYHNLVRLWAES